MPKQLAKQRFYVDAGSAVFNEVVRSVPVLPQKSHALVSRQIREKSLESMISVDVCELEAKDPHHQPSLPMDDCDEDAATAGADVETAEAAAAHASKSFFCGRQEAEALQAAHGQ